MIQIHPKLRDPLVHIAVLVLSILVVAACGDENDSDKSTPTPTAAATVAPVAAATPAATAAPTAGGTDAATPPPTDAPAKSVSFSGSESLFLSANETGEVTVDLMARDVLEVTFDVESNITGGQNFMSGEGKASGGVQVVISDPLETSLLTIDEITDSGTVSVEAEVNGEHVIIFFNPFPMQAQSVEVSYTVNP